MIEGDSSSAILVKLAIVKHTSLSLNRFSKYCDNVKANPPVQPKRSPAQVTNRDSTSCCLSTKGVVLI